MIKEQINNHFQKVVEEDDRITNAYLLVHSKKQGIHLNIAEGTTEGILANPEQPFFIASIDKLFISVLKKNFKAKFPPGEKFSYSDIGYFLLILIIEKVTEKHYPELLKEIIFQHLNMNHTYIFQHTKPLNEIEYPIATCYITHTNVAEKTKLGMDYVGGRLVSTTEDLLLFMKALVYHELISKETMEKMKIGQNILSVLTMDMGL